ncbi:MAG: type IV pilus modification protein PilV [Rhodanobacteraceae bacterium]
MIRFASPRAVRGVSLIEVLIAIVIFSLGLIGLALMQLKGATFTKEAGSRTMAVLQARSLADRMQANPVAVADGGYAWNSSVSPGYTDCSVTACTPDQVATNDIAEWLGRI